MYFPFIKTLFAEGYPSIKNFKATLGTKFPLASQDGLYYEAVDNLTITLSAPQNKPVYGESTSGTNEATAILPTE